MVPLDFIQHFLELSPDVHQEFYQKFLQQSFWISYSNSWKFRPELNRKFRRISSLVSRGFFFSGGPITIIGVPPGILSWFLQEFYQDASRVPSKIPPVFVQEFLQKILRISSGKSSRALPGIRPEFLHEFLQSHFGHSQKNLFRDPPGFVWEFLQEFLRSFSRISKFLWEIPLELHQKSLRISTIVPPAIPPEI